MDSNSRDAPPDVLFYVRGTPKGKGRPRFSRDRHGRVRTHTPRDTMAYEASVACAYLEQVGAAWQRPHFPKDVPLYLGVEIFFAPPRSAGKKRTLDMLSGKILPTKRPDADNVLKAVADALNGLAYADDAQLVEMAASKKYGACDGIRVRIHPVPGKS